MAWIWRGGDTTRAMKMKMSKTMTDQKMLDQFNRGGRGRAHPSAG